MKALSIALCFFLVLTFGGFSQAQVLFIVDESNPNLTTITATPAAAAVDVPSGDFTFYDGVDLTGFFSQDASNLFASTPSTLTTGDTSANLTLPLFMLEGDNLSGGDSGPDLDLNLFNPAGGSETFTPPSPAFTGVVVADFPLLSTQQSSTYALSGNPTGDVYAGWSGDMAPVLIGTYEVVVPEPSTYAMMGLGLLALIGIRRFRRLS